MPGVATPPLLVMGFAQGAAGTYLQNPIPVTTSDPSRASLMLGFPPLTATPELAGGVAPQIADFNGVLLAATANIAAWTGGQYWPFSATWATANGGYAIGAIVAMASGVGFWLNQVAGNQNNPDTTALAGSGWVPLMAYGAGATSTLTGTLTLSAVVAQRPMIFVTGLLSGNLTLVFPTWNQQWLIVNNTTGLFTVTCTTAGGTGVVVPQGGASNATMIFGDGTNIQALYAGLDTIVLARSVTAAIVSNIAPAPDSQLITPFLPPGTYRVQAKLWVAAVSGGTNPGARLFLNSDASSASAVGYYSGTINGTQLTPSVQTVLQIGSNFATIVTTGADFLSIEATLGLIGVGRIFINWAQSTSSASATKLLQGSTLTVQALQG